MLTERDFPNPKLSQGVVMTYVSHYDSVEYIGLRPKEQTREVIGAGHFLVTAKPQIKLTTTQLLLSELKLDLSKIPTHHTHRRSLLETRIKDLEKRV